MGSRYLTDLANVVRSIGGFAVQEEPGWQSRARSSGGYNSGLPNHVMCHHTASGSSSDGQSDVNYMCYGSDNRPIANLYLSRTGKVWIMAAGATNTNGSGHDPCGATANDSMNSAAIGIEAANNGTGETWPTVQQDVYTKLVNKLCSQYGIPIGRVHSHFEWAPDRKIDPAGNSRYASGGNKWNMDAFRGDVIAGGEPSPGPTPPPGERKKLMYVLLLDDNGAYWGTNMMEVRYLYSTTVLNTFKNMLTVFGYGTDPTNVKQADVLSGCYGYIIGNPPTAAGKGTVDSFVEPWGHQLDAASGMPAGEASAIIQEIRANVRG